MQKQNKNKVESSLLAVTIEGINQTKNITDGDGGLTKQQQQQSLVVASDFLGGKRVAVSSDRGWRG